MKTFILAVLLALSGCASLGTVAPTSVGQQLAYAEGTTAGIRQSCTNALTTGVLTTSGAQNCLTITDAARTAIDAGNAAVSSGDSATAATKLALVNSLLLQIQQQLTAQGVK